MDFHAALVRFIEHKLQRIVARVLADIAGQYLLGFPEGERPHGLWLSYLLADLGLFVSWLGHWFRS